MEPNLHKVIFFFLHIAIFTSFYLTYLIGIFVAFKIKILVSRGYRYLNSRGGARTMDYQSFNSRGGAGKKHLNHRSSHSQNQGYRPRQTRVGASYGSPKDYRHNTSGRQDNRRGRHVSAVTRNQSSRSATTSCVAGSPIVTYHRSNDEHQRRVTSREPRTLIGPSTLTQEYYGTSLPVLPDEQQPRRESRQMCRGPDRFGLY